VSKIEQLDRERLRMLVLARLWARTKRPIGRKRVLVAVAGLISSTPSPELRTAIERCLDDCAAMGLVGSKPLALTPSGHEWLIQRLGVDEHSHTRSWPDIRRRLLVALTLDESQTHKSPFTTDELAAALLSMDRGWQVREASLKQVVDRMAWSALGIDTDASFEVDRVQRYLLRDLVSEDARVDAHTWRRLLAVKAAAARRGDAQSFRRALMTRWVCGTPASTLRTSMRHATGTANDNSRPTPDLPDLAAAVMRAAREPDVHRFHDDRAFIGSIWAHMRGRPPVGDMSLDEFKKRLVAAHATGLLHMTRADMVGAMDPTELQRSEATHMGTTFHFVALKAGGAR
jgi:hypothetical protein